MNNIKYAEYFINTMLENRVQWTKWKNIYYTMLYYIFAIFMIINKKLIYKDL